MFELLEKAFDDSGANVIRYAMYQQGQVFSQERIKTYPCSNCYSISKSFTATAVGMAVDRGLLSEEDFLVDLLREELPETYDPNLKQVKIKHLLTQTMGLSKGLLFETDRYTHGTDDFLRVALSVSLPYAPGQTFVYSNSTYYILSCVIEKVTGQTLDMFLQTHLFAKIGINGFAWERCPKGHTMGATGLYLRTEDMLKLGILYMNQGVWEGERLLSTYWVKTATTKREEFGDLPKAYSFYYEKDGRFGCNGANSQFLMVFPERKIVFAVHSYDEKHQIFETVAKFVGRLGE